MHHRLQLPVLVPDRGHPRAESLAGRRVHHRGADVTILIVQGLVAMMRDWLARLPEKHQNAVHEITYSADSTVTKSRRRKLWILAAAVMVLAFGGAVGRQLRDHDAAGGRRRDLDHRPPRLRRRWGGEHHPGAGGRRQGRRRPYRVRHPADQGPEVRRHPRQQSAAAGRAQRAGEGPHPGRADGDHRALRGLRGEDPVAGAVDRGVEEDRPAGSARGQAARRRESRHAQPAAGPAGRPEGDRLVHLPLDQPRGRRGHEAAPARSWWSASSSRSTSAVCRR